MKWFIFRMVDIVGLLLNLVIKGINGLFNQAVHITATFIINVGPEWVAIIVAMMLVIAIYVIKFRNETKRIY